VVFDYAREAMFLLDGERILDCNRAMEQILGYSRADLLAMTPADFSSRTQPGGAVSRIEAARRIGLGMAGTSQFFEWRHLRSSGETLDVEVSLNPVELDGRRVLLAIWRDITERKRVEARLRVLSRVVEQSPVSVVITDTHGLIEYVNPKFEQVTGYSAAEAFGQNPRFLKSGLMAPEVYSDLWKTILAGKEWRGELVNRKKNAEIYWEYATIGPIKDENGTTVQFAAVKEDITERKRLEEELLRAQRLEAIGRLAGGVAHDMNNLLTVINGYSEILLARLGQGSPMREQIGEIRNAGKRGETLTKQLLAFSRQQAMSPRVLNVNAVIVGIESMLRRLVGEGVEIRTQLSDDIGNIRADHGQLEQVLMNLAVNARDAMPAGGLLVVETAAAEVQADTVPGLASGPYVRLSVTDTGFGMDDETRAHIFEPFFTTKEEGKGTGLGLAIAYGIVKQSGGDLQVTSVVGVGTTFTAYFPQVDDAAGDEQWQTQTTPSQTAVNGATILLVEDDPPVRTVVKAFLDQAGYRVLTADSPAHALELCDTLADGIDLLLTDVVMPAMNGPELARQVLQRHPKLKVLFMSGHTREGPEWGSRSTGQDEGADSAAIIQKPFTAETLTARVSEVLGAAGAASVLIVDDEVLVRSYFREVLERAGYQVHEAGDGKQAMQIMDEQTVDLMITDLVMPDQEGLETLRDVKQRGRRVKVIAVSGAAPNYLKVAKLMGADSTLTKPVMAEELVAEVRRVLAGA
jgi:PAS domain S-box-containing protein